MRIAVAAILISVLTLVGCASDCETSLRLAVLKVEESHYPGLGRHPDLKKRTRNLSELLGECQVPESGLTVSVDYVLTDAEVFILAGEFQKAETLLPAAIDNLGDADATRLLSTSARFGHLSNLESVVNHGVTPTLRDSIGNTALMAVPGGREPVVAKMEYLLGQGLELSDRNEHGFSTLDTAIVSGDAASISWILGRLNTGTEDHANLVRRSLEIAISNESPFSTDLEKWINEASENGR